jgi:hypothetical protein
MIGKDSKFGHTARELPGVLRKRRGILYFAGELSSIIGQIC